MRSHLLVALMLSSAAVAADQPAPGAKDQERLQGTWRVVALENEGKPVPAEAIKGATLTFTKDQYELKGGREEFRGRFKLHATQEPRGIDSTFVEADGKEKGVAVGIYKLEGDRLTICWRQGDKDRPREFGSKPESGLRLLVAERVKP